MSSVLPTTPAAPSPQPPRGRAGLVVLASVILGLAIGWAWTAGELGFPPGGGSGIELGNAIPTPPAPPPPPKGPPPKLVADETEFNFGKSEKETAGRHDLIIKNTGRGMLTLTQGESDCSCTVEEIVEPKIPPGGSTAVTVKWTPRQRGPFLHRVEVFSDDPGQPKLELTVTGEITTTYQISPADLTITALDPTKPQTYNVQIFSFATTDVTALHPTLSDRDTGRFFDLAVEPMPAAEVKQGDGAKSGCILKVSIKPGLPAGRFEQKIRFSLNLPSKPEIEYSVIGDVISPIEVTGPETVWDPELGMAKLGVVRGGEGAEAKLYLVIRPDAAKRANLRIHEILPDTLHATIGKIEIQPSGAARVPLTISVPKGSRSADHLGKQGASLGRILIDTGLDESKQLRLLVRYAVVED